MTHHCIQTIHGKTDRTAIDEVTVGTNGLVARVSLVAQLYTFSAFTKTAHKLILLLLLLYTRRESAGRLHASETSVMLFRVSHFITVIFYSCDFKLPPETNLHNEQISWNNILYITKKTKRIDDILCSGKLFILDVKGAGHRMVKHKYLLCWIFPFCSLKIVNGSVSFILSLCITKLIK